MCRDCGCSPTGQIHIHRQEGSATIASSSPTSIELTHGILHGNDQQARHNREHFQARGILAVNLMSAPGAGKTSLLEATIDELRGRYRIAVLEGDLETDNDARRIRAKGVPAIQITTGQACHLDAEMVHEAIHGLDLSEIDVLFIENVGNLVCPAMFDLGQQANVILLAVTEGDDKPAKYPVMFRAADLVLLSKCDLLEVLDDFSVAQAIAHQRKIGNPVDMFEVSARRRASLAPWIAWLEAQAVSLASRNGRDLVHSHPAAK